MNVSHPPGRSGVRWRVLGLMFAASFVGYLLRSNLSVVAERMMVDLQLTQIQFGMVLAAFAWSYALFQVPGGLWGDRIGARKAMAIAAASWGVITLLMGLIPAADILSTSVVIGVLVLLRALMGAAQAPLYPITSGSMVFRWFPVSGWAFPNGLSSAGLTLGAAAAGPVMVWLALEFGWRQSFLYTAPLAFLLAASWWWYVRDTPAQHAQVRQDELALIDAARPASVAASVALRPWRDVLANRQVLLLTASYFCSNYVFYFFFNWLYVYLVESRGFRELEGGYYAAAPWITGAVFALAGGVVCDALTRRVGIRRSCRWSAMAGLLFSGLFLAAAAMATDPRIAVICLCLCMGGQQFAEAPFWAATVSVAGRDSGSACGVLNTGGNVVGGVGALLVPITVKALGWPVALATGTAFAIIGASLWLWISADATIGDGAQTTGVRP